MSDSPMLIVIGFVLAAQWWVACIGVTVWMAVTAEYTLPMCIVLLVAWCGWMVAMWIAEEVIDL